MKLYIASSWKNAFAVRALADLLRAAGHDVYDFTDNEKHFAFDVASIGNPEAMTQFELMNMPEAEKAFKNDKGGIDWADGLVMLLPCGNSAHAEFGYAAGLGKPVFITGSFKKGDWDVMRMFAPKAHIQPTPMKLIDAIDAWVTRL